MFQELHNQMVSLAIDSQSQGLFTSFENDLHKHDKDIVLNDMQVGDSWLWVVKQCGTYLVLVSPGNEYLDTIVSTIKRDGMARRYFIISVLQDRCDISEVPPLEVQDVVAKLPYIKNRVPKRRFAYNLLVEAFPSLKGSVMFADHDFENGAELYLAVTANSVTYASMKTFKTRNLPLPFDLNRASGYLKLTVTTEFGHGQLEPITARAYNFAVKKAIKRAA